MSGALKIIGKIAGVVAIVAAVAVPFVGPALAATLLTVAGVASAVSALAMFGSSLLAKPPASRGQVSQIVTGANNAQPYLMGRSYIGGNLVHDVGYGGSVDKVDNPYRFMAVVNSCCGPVEELEAVQLDFVTIPFSGTAATGYYAGYFWRDFQLGARPEGDALAPQFVGAYDWGAGFKLSGFAAIGYSFKFDKDGKRFAGGNLPVIGAIWKGVKVYDPRLDSTYPGGSGAQRITDEATWTYSTSPALHALAYAYGRYVNGVKVFGVDIGAAAIDLGSVVAWANVCDFNGWQVNGSIYEPGDKWANLKRICEAGACLPVLQGGVLRFDFQSPRTSLYTITRDDLAVGPVSAKLSKGWKNRHNIIVPRYRSEANQWNYAQAGSVQVPAWITADGEEKSDERQWDLVTGVDQVTELAIYDLYQRREAGPFKMALKPHMMGFVPGDCLTLSAELGVHPDGAIKAVIRSRSVDPNSGLVTLEFEQEDDAKHAAALGADGVPPPTITLPSGADFDTTSYQNSLPSGQFVTTENMVPDSAVDLASVVPGELNTGVVITQSGEIRQELEYAANTQTDAVCTTPAVSVSSATDSIFLDVAVTVSQGGGAGGRLKIEKSTDGATWALYKYLNAVGNANNTGQANGMANGDKYLNTEHLGHTAGDLYFRLVVTGNGSVTAPFANYGDPAYDLVITGGSLRVRRFFSK